MKPFVNYLIARRDEETEIDYSESEITGSLYDYVLAADGVYLRAERQGIRVLFPIGEAPIKGLREIEASVRIDYPPVPLELTNRIVAESLRAVPDSGQEQREVLFHLMFDERKSQWVLIVPEQVQTATSVRPVRDDPDSSYAHAFIEVHSHGRIPPFYSADADDVDEQGFRLYGVIGNLGVPGKRPGLRLRVGCYGYFYEIPSRWMFEMPDGLDDPIGKDWDERAKNDDTR